MSTHPRVLIGALIALMLCGTLGTPTATMAQSYPPPIFNHWLITYTCSGTQTTTTTDKQGYTTTNTQAWTGYNNSPGWRFGAGSQSPYPSNLAQATASLNGTVNITLIWVDANGNPAPNPPKQVYMLETNSSSYSGSGTVSGNANDGFSDPVITGTSAGLHLIQMDGSSGSLTLTTSPSGSVNSSNTTSSPFAMLQGSVSITLDTRAIEITTSLGQTYHCIHEDGAPPGVHSQVANGYVFGGPSRDDTVYPYYSGGYDITYFGLYTGNWANNSSYHWYSSLIGDVAQSTFQPQNIDPFIVTYQPGFCLPGQQDHIYLHAIDAQDGANASANEYVHFHDMIEPGDNANWPDDPGYPMVPSATQGYPWKAMVAQTSGGVVLPQNQWTIPILVGPQGTGAGFSEIFQMQTSNTVGGGIDISATVVAAHFDLSQTSDISNVSIAVNIVPTPDLPAGYETWPVYREQVIRDRGQRDHYNSSGYWHADWWQHDKHNGFEYSFMHPYPRSGTAAGDPPPGWTP